MHFKSSAIRYNRKSKEEVSDKILKSLENLKSMGDDKLNRKNLTKQNSSIKINLKLGFSKEELKFLSILFFYNKRKIKIGRNKKIPRLNFTLRIKNERYGRNPKTGEEAIIKKRKVVRFKSSKLLKTKINK